MRPRALGIVGIVLVASRLAGCASPVAVGYAPLAGVERAPAAPQAVSMQPASRVQRGDEPLFTVDYVNATPRPVVFGPDNVQATFRGRAVPLWTRDALLEAAQARDAAGRLAELLLGGVAVAAVLYGLAQPSVASVDTGVGRVFVREANDRFVAAVAVGAAAEAGLQETQAAGSRTVYAPAALLAPRTVPPGGSTRGLVALRDCCDRERRADDVVRFDVTVDGRTESFAFARVRPEEAPRLAGAGPAAATFPPVAPPGGSAAPPAARAGDDAWSAERFARSRRCEASAASTLVEKGAGHETWSVPCRDGRSLAVRCDYGRCSSP